MIPKGAWRATRYARSWKVGAEVLTEETEIARNGEGIPASLLRPLRGNAPFPAWIAMGGVTCMGRHHPQLVRFSRALAASGAAVLVPDIPEWRRLKLAPDAVEPTLRACIDLLKSRVDIARAPFGLIGFSFGAPQVAISSARGDLGDNVAAIVLFGGYCSLEKTMSCQLTGSHEWEGRDYCLSPDPFGGWVVASNHLTDAPGFEEAGDVAAALSRLAHAASGQRIPAWDPRHDGLIRELRQALPQRRRRVFDLFATPSTQALPEPEERQRVAVLLAEACRRMEPLLDPATALRAVAIPTRLFHGRGDRLIPFTESHRLQASLPGTACRSLTVTGLFNHTASSTPPRLAERAYESLKMFSAVRAMLNMV